jgi:ATP-binding cassette, subfamily B, multidrug efflux pump
MDSQFYETYQKGDLISRVTADLDAITQAASSMLEGIVFNVGVIFFAIAVMATSISLNLTLISISIMPIGLNDIKCHPQQKKKIY